jgi:hypothetical protein
MDKTLRCAPMLGLVLALAVSGCSGALRSGSVDQLATLEATKLKALHDMLADRRPQVDKAIDGLKTSYHLQLMSPQLWEQQLMYARLVAAVPGNLNDPLIKRALYIELADLRLNQANQFAAQEAAFDAKAEALKAAYAKLVEALAQAQKDFGPVAAYAGASTVAFAAQSVDVATIGAAIGEFKEAQKILADAQAAASKAQPIIGAAAKLAPDDAAVQNFLAVLSQISARIKEVPSQ